MKRGTCIGALLVLVCAVTAVHAQVAPAAPRVVSDDATLRPGDAVQITVVDNGNFSGVYVVSQDGRIPYPFMKDENVLDWTMDELGDRIANKLAPVLARAPYVIVDRAVYYTIRINILGQINTPGFIDVPNDIDLQGALWMAGGPTGTADLTNIQVQRIGPDGGLELLQVNLEKFLYEGRVADLVRMKEGDLVIVKGAPDADKVKVFGEVGNSGSFVRPYGATVLDMIYLAGGETETGTLSDVRWLRRIDGRIVEEKLDIASMLREGRTDDIPLVGRGDVIIVQKKILTLDLFFTTLSVIFQLFAVRELIRRV